MQKIQIRGKKLGKACIAWLLIFAFLLALSHCVPLTCDDWFKINRSGLPLNEYIAQSVNGFWNDHHGRVLGDVLILACANLSWLRVLLWWAIMCAMLYLIAASTGWNRSATGALLALLFVFTAPKAWFTGTIVWHTAFYMYVTNVVCILLYLCAIRNLFSDIPIRDTAPRAAGLLVLGFCTQFFVENMTVYSALVGFAVVIWHYIRFKKLSFNTIAYALGAAVGAYVMFNAPCYAQALSGENGFYGAANSIGMLIYKVEQNYAMVSAYGVGINSLLLGLISALCIAIICKADVANSRQAQRYRTPLTILLVALPIYFFATTRYTDSLLPLENLFGNLRAAIVLDALLYALWALSIVATLLLYVADTRCRRYALFLLASVFICIAPLIAVSPIRQRVFVCNYIFLILLTLTLLRYCKDRFALSEAVEKTLRISVYTAFTAVCVLFFCGYSMNPVVEKQRETYVDTMIDKGVDAMYIPDFLCPDLVYASLVTFDAGHYREVRGDVVFFSMPYYEWKERYYDTMAVPAAADFPGYEAATD